MKSLLTTLLLITGIITAQIEVPNVPQTTSFQAVITDSLGVPIADGTRTFTFRMEKPTDTGTIIEIWEETQEVEVVNGVISAVLGSVTPLNPIPFSGYTFQNTTYNLIISSDGEDISVIPLTSVPFALNASSTNYAAHAIDADHAINADTAHFVMATPMSDTSSFAHEAYHSVYTDTSGFTHQSLNSTYADTAHYMNLSHYNYLIRVVKDDDANITIHSNDDNSSSFLTLISQTSAGDQRELRVINEGDIGGGFKVYDATKHIDLMVLDTSGSLTASKFVGNGSELTNITITNFGVTATATELNIMDGVTATTEEINYVDGVTAAIQTQMDGKQPLDPDLTDLADGTLSASLVEHGSYFIPAPGDVGQVWTSDGSYAGHWLAPYATTLADLALTATAAELNIMDGVTATNTELNIIDGVTATTAELNYVSGVSSAIQTQMDAKQALDADLTDLADGTLTATKVENGEYFISAAGTSGQVWTSDGTGAGAWGTTTATTLPTLGVTATDAELNIMDGVTATAAEINFVDGVTSAVQTQLDAKQATVTGAASSIVTNNLTASRAVVTAANGKVAVSDVTSAELDYVDGVTSAIQTQLDAKQALDAELTDLADGELTATLVQYGSLFITTEGTSGKVWTSDGSGAGAWVTSTAASALDGLSDVLIESSSLYIGNDPASTTSTAEKNVAVGTTALDAVTTGDDNVAIGYNALTANTTASNNSALGFSSLADNISGQYNTGTGSRSLQSNTTADYNTASGYYSLVANTTGSGNTSVGAMSLIYNTSGDDNMAAGRRALYANTGDNNTALGAYAGDVITSGSNNVLLGTSADPSANSASNQIVIGYGATGHGDNIAVIGNGSATAIHPHDDDEVDLGSSTYEYKDLYVDGTANVDALNLNGTAVSATAAELNIMDGVTSTAAELNIMDGVTATAAEINYVDGVTSAVQTQLDAKQALDADLTDLAEDSELTATLVQYGSLFITTAGTDGYVWTSDGTGAGGWEATAAASTVDGLSDAKSGGTDFTSSLLIGHQTTGTLSEAEKNVGVGTTALDAITEGDNNVAVGYDAATANTTGGYNTALGTGALNANITSDRSTATGFRSLYIATGAGNTAFGSNSGDNITTGTNNVLLGYVSDASSASGTNQIAIGYNATGHGDNIAVIGNTDMTAWHPADDGGVDLGSSSYEFKDLYVDGVSYADAIGFGTVAMTLPTADGSSGQVLQTNSSGTLSWTTNGSVSDLDDLSDVLVEATSSIYVGNDPSGTTSSANYNVALGTTALDAITTGDNNVAVGYDALTSNTTGEDNTASGYQALKTNISGDKNTASGYQALYSNTTGHSNTATGHYSMYSNTTGNANTATGYQSMKSNTEGGYNTASGYYSLYSNTEGIYNTANGYQSLYSNTTGQNNTASGFRSLYLNVNGYRNTGFGDMSLSATVQGSDNTAVGYYALKANTSASDNTALGKEAGDVITTGSDNIIIGSESDPSAAAASNQIVIGKGATGHGNNIAVIGNGSATAIHPHDDNEVDLGSSSYEYKDLYVDGVAYADAIGFGTVVMTLPTTDGSSGQVLYTNASGTLAWGTRSAVDDLEETYSLYVGNDPSGTTGTAQYNVALGTTALDAITEGDNNVAVGYDALGANTTGSKNNVLGYQAGAAIVAGTENIAIGYRAGNVIAAGTKNIIIGSDSDPSGSSADNQIVIGAGITGTGDDEINLGNTDITAIKAQVTSITGYSDSRIKKDIRNSDLGLAFINMLRPVKYKLKNPADYPLAIREKRFTERNEPRPEDNETVYNGLIAQEVKAAMDELGIEWSGWSENESNGKQGLQYGALTVPLIKAVQEQQDQIEGLMKKYDELAAQNQKLLDMMSN